MIRNILWEVDGVLFDTHPAMTYAFSKSLNGMGLTVAMNEIDGLVRKPVDDCIADLSKRFKLDPGLLRLRFDESYLMIPPANQPLFPGVQEICSLFQERGGVNIIVTHHHVESTQQLLDAHGLGHLFVGILDLEQGYPCKPAPALVEIAMECFNLDPTETLLLGSRDIDIQAGRAAGVQTCLFGDMPISGPADMQIISYSQLLGWLDKQNKQQRKEHAT